MFVTCAELIQILLIMHSICFIFGKIKSAHRMHKMHLSHLQWHPLCGFHHLICRIKPESESALSSLTHSYTHVNLDYNYDITWWMCGFWICSLEGLVHMATTTTTAEATTYGLFREEWAVTEAMRLFQICLRLLIKRCRSDTTYGKDFQTHRKHTKMILNC